MENVSVLQGGAAALLAFVVYLILSGRLIPRSQFDGALAAKEKELDRADRLAKTWSEAYELSEQARRLQAEHILELMELSRTTTRVLTSLPVAPTTRPPPPQGADDAPAMA